MEVSMRRIQNKWLFWLMLSLVSLAACQRDQPVGPDTGVPLEAKFSSIQENILTPKCVNRGCHPPAGPMSLEKGQAYNNLVNQASGYGMPRVDPSNADNSALYLKVKGDARVGGVQNRMPLGFPALSSEEIQVIRDWINAGAPNN